ncbi:MAG: HmuY family protein [Myxococcota bacterium]
MNTLKIFRTSLLVAGLSLTGFACSDDTATDDDDNTQQATTPPDDDTETTDGTETTAPSDGSCLTARETAIGPIDSVSDGAINILIDNDGDRTAIVNAQAGGFNAQRNNPWLYIDLDTMTRVDVTDMDAFEDTTWDVAVKRIGWRTNSGDSGPGMGGAIWLNGAIFEDVTAESIVNQSFATEVWFDENCNYETDQTGALVTSFGDDWYNYQSMVVTPRTGVFIIQGRDGESLYKLEVERYYSLPDGEAGTPGIDSARYRLRVQAL